VYQALPWDARRSQLPPLVARGADSLFGKSAEEKMRRVAVSGTVALFLLLLNTNGFAKPPIPLTDCETITHRGNYILENDLVLPLIYSGGQGGIGNCLVISSPHVKIDLNGLTITTACVLPDGLPCPGVVQGGIGIDIEADHVSIANGHVGEFDGGFTYGIVGDGRYISATNLDITTDVGIVLTDVSYSAFTNISYAGADTRLHSENGPVLSVTGGGNNTFMSINSPSITFEGAIIANSSNNFIDGADIFCTAQGEAGPGILLTQDSSQNFLANNNIFVLFGNGIEVDLGSDDNVIQNNTVKTATTPPGFFAMLDQNPDCGSNVWTSNSFSNEFAPGQISASPANCIH
jgi:hypothetical protein